MPPDRAHAFFRARSLVGRTLGAVMMLVGVICVWSAEAGAPTQARFPCRYEIKRIIEAEPCQIFPPPDPPQPSPTHPRAISNHDPAWVTGYFKPCGLGWDSIFYSTGPGHFQHLTLPGMTNAYGFDVTDTGWVVGTYSITGIGQRGFIYDTNSGQWTQIDPPIAGGGVTVRAANNLGMVVGSRTTPDGTAYNAFVWQNGKAIDLGVMNGPFSEAMDISNSGVAVGWTGFGVAGPGTRAFVSMAGLTTVLDPIPGGTNSGAFAAIDSGAVLVSGNISAPVLGGYITRGVVWEGQYRSLLEPLPGYLHSFAEDASEDEMTHIGSSGGPSIGTNPTATIWRNGKPIELISLVPVHPNPTWLFRAIDINERGEIVCDASFGIGTAVVVLSPKYGGPGDIVPNCRTDMDDLLFLIRSWGSTDASADINNDGVVDVQDLTMLLSDWTVP